MGSIRAISKASDRVMETLISGLELEFGRAAAEGLAQRIWQLKSAIFIGMRALMSGGLAPMRASKRTIANSIEWLFADGSMPIGSLRCALSMAMVWRTE